MQKLVIIFTDTNKLFRALGYRKQDSARLETSRLSTTLHTSTYTFYVSFFVVQELKAVYLRRVGPIQTEEIIRFLEQLGCRIIDSLQDSDPFLKYVTDSYDAPILRDAVACQADYLRTDNVKDFRTEAIAEKFGIQIIRDLLEINVEEETST